jgi:hypothetical protein
MSLRFATGPSLNHSERPLIKSNQDEINYQQQQMMNGQYIIMSVNGGSTICGLVSSVIYQWLGCGYAQQTYSQLFLAKRQQQSQCPILSMSVNRASIIVSFPSWLSYIPIGFRHPFMRYWQPCLAETTATCFLWHLETECQWRVNGYRTCIFCNQGIALIFTCILVLLTTLLCKNTICQRCNTDNKLIDIAHSSTI